MWHQHHTISCTCVVQLELAQQPHPIFHRENSPPQKSHRWKTHGKIQHFQLPSGTFVFPSSHFPAKSSRQVRRIQTNNNFFSKKRLSWRGELDHGKGQDVDICKCERSIIGETFSLRHGVRRGRLSFTQSRGWIIRYFFFSVGLYYNINLCIFLTICRASCRPSSTYFQSAPPIWPFSTSSRIYRMVHEAWITGPQHRPPLGHSVNASGKKERRSGLSR